MWLACLLLLSLNILIRARQTKRKAAERAWLSLQRLHQQQKDSFKPSGVTLWTKGREWVDLQWRLCTLHYGQRGEQFMQIQGSQVYTASREDETIHNCDVDRRMFRHPVGSLAAIYIAVFP